MAAVCLLLPKAKGDVGDIGGGDVLRASFEEKMDVGTAVANCDPVCSWPRARKGVDTAELLLVV